MHGLKQATILAYQLVVKRLAAESYCPIPLTNGHFKQNIRNTVFSLCGNDFSVKYHSQQGLQHLILTLYKYHDI